MNAGRIVMMIAGLLMGPMSAVAVPVTWEAQGSVDPSSNLTPAFIANFIPELAGTQPGDDLVLRISFDRDAALIARTPNGDGGTTFSFDALSLTLSLGVPGRGTHVFDIDNPIPGAGVRPQLFILDDFVTPGSLIFDSLQFGHQYLTESGALAFSVIAVFSSTDTSVLDDGTLPSSPDSRLSAGFEHGITINATGNGSLFGTFSSLLPTKIAEPGSIALLCLGLAALRVVMRDRARSYG